MVDRLLILADDATGVQAQQLEPFARLRPAPRVAHVRGLGDVAAHLRGASAVALQPHFRRGVDEVRRAIAALRDVATRVSLLDSTDSTALRWPTLLSAVDVYVKKQLRRDPRAYATPTRTGYAFADWCETEMGWPLGDWKLADAPAPADALDRLALGWTLGAADAHARFARACRWRERLGLATRWRGRPIDVHCVASTLGPGDSSFYSRHRRAFAEALGALSPGWARVVSVFGGSGGARPPFTRRQYLRSLRQAKLVVSPFGWGEVCHRDYEAVAAGCLLVKPDMGDVVARPDVFVAGETYVPVRWDGADLASTCEAWLARPDEAAALARRGQVAFAAYVDRDQARRDAANLAARLCTSPDAAS